VEFLKIKIEALERALEIAKNLAISDIIEGSDKNVILHDFLLKKALMHALTASALEKEIILLKVQLKKEEEV